MNCSVWDVISGEVEMLQRGYNNARTTSSYKKRTTTTRVLSIHSIPLQHKPLTQGSGTPRLRDSCSVGFDEGWAVVARRLITAKVDEGGGDAGNTGLREVVAHLDRVLEARATHRDHHGSQRVRGQCHVHPVRVLQRLARLLVPLRRVGFQRRGGTEGSDVCFWGAREDGGRRACPPLPPCSPHPSNLTCTMSSALPWSLHTR